MARRKWTLKNKRDMEQRAWRLREARASGRPSAGILEEVRIARSSVGLDVLQEERDLALSCWIEYGYLRAFERTELFTTEYERQFRLFHGKYFDHVTVEDCHPINPEFAGNSHSEMTQLWRARQHADAIGMPYAMFIGQAMESTLIKEGHKRIPRPNQLYSEQPLTHAVSYWKEHSISQTLFRAGWDPRFRAENYTGDPVQARALSLIEGRVNAKQPASKALSLGSYLIRSPAITEPEARKRFGDELVELAIAEVGPVPELGAPTTSMKRTPGCLGLAWSQSHPSCGACPLSGLCQKFVDKLDNEFMHAYGDTDPKRARKRAGAAERKRRERARKRAKGTHPGGKLVAKTVNPGA